MGVNDQTGDKHPEAVRLLCVERREKLHQLAEKVRAGEMNLEDYIMKVKGYKAEHVPFVRENIRKFIFGEQKTLQPGD